MSETSQISPNVCLMSGREGDVKICRDPDDDLILETAIQGDAAYLVSRDDDVKGDEAVITFMHENSVQIVTVDQFWQILQDAQST